MTRYSALPAGQVKQVIYVLTLLALMAAFYTYAIVGYPFPHSLIFLFLLPALAVFFLDLRWGIVLWFLTSGLGNGLVIYWPGIPALRPVHIGLFLLLAVWFVKSHGELPSVLSRFLATAKNRLLLLLLGWVTLSMVMAQLEGVTQRGVGYQFSAWLAALLPILVAFAVSTCLDERFLNNVIWIIVGVQTALMLAMIAAGVAQGVGLTGWKAFAQQYGMSIQIVSGSPLLLALVFFRQQHWLGKVLFSAAIAVQVVVDLLLIAGGHRSSVLDLVSTFGFFLLFTKGRLLVPLLLVALPVAALNVSAIQSWSETETERTLTYSGLSYGGGSRIDLAGDAIQIITDHPFWGTGSDFYRLHSGMKFIYPGGAVKPAATPHNSWLQVAADSGIPALLLLVAFCAFAFRDAWRLWRSSPNALARRYALFFLCTLSVAVASSFIGSGQILPLFTGVEGDEGSVLAGPLLGFWLPYGLLLALEKPSDHTAVPPEVHGAVQ